MQWMQWEFLFRVDLNKNNNHILIYLLIYLFSFSYHGVWIPIQNRGKTTIKEIISNTKKAKLEKVTQTANPFVVIIINYY